MICQCLSTRLTICCVAALLLACILALPALARQGLPGDSLWRWTFLGDAQISPDGSRIAYVHVSVSDEKDTYTLAFWLADVRIRETRPLTSGGNGAARGLAPRWSPDGRPRFFVPG